MRLLQVTIPTGKRETVLVALDDVGVDYVVTDETSGREYTAIVYVPLPIAGVDPVLDRLREVGLDEDAYTVVIDANTVISRRFNETKDRFAEEEDEEQIAREELRTRAEELAPRTNVYEVLTIISAIVATAGLLLDSPATVVGSMVIAPLIGPAMAASIGTVLDDRELFVRGVKLQVWGLVLAVLSAAAFAWVAKTGYLVPPDLSLSSLGEVEERLLPNFLSLAVALGAGVAGALSLSAGMRAAIVGVMIAVALIPPAATVGISIAWLRPSMALGSGILTLVNLLSINFAALVVLWYEGYRPVNWFRLDAARSALLKRGSILVVTIVLLSVFLGGVTYGAFVQATSEQEITAEVESVVESEEFADVTLVRTSIEYNDDIIVREPERVIVRVGVPPDYEQQGLAARIERRVQRDRETDVTVAVQYVTVESAS